MPNFVLVEKKAKILTTMPNFVLVEKKAKILTTGIHSRISRIKI
jgi:hypothetical protein